MKDDVYSEKGKVTTKKSYVYLGYGMDAQSIYAEYETKFSIAKGVIKDHIFIRNVTEDGETYNSFIR